MLYSGYIGWFLSNLVVMVMQPSTITSIVLPAGISGIKHGTQSSE